MEKQEIQKEDNDVLNENLHKKKLSTKVLEKAKRIGGAAVNLAEAGAGLILTVGIPPVGIPIAVDGILRFSNKLTSNKSNKSMIMYSDSKWYCKLMGGEKNYITQSFNNIADLGKGAIVKDKKTFLLTQELNLLLGAEKYEDNGTKRVFNTKSQGLTRLMLSRAEKAGLVENFECKETDKRRLIGEKIMLGNYSELLKKDRMFNMKFELTDKQPTEEQIKKFLKVKELDENIFKITKDKEGNISSINYKTSYAIKDRMQRFKDKLFYNPSLDSKKTPLLEESKENKQIVQSEPSKSWEGQTKLTDEITNIDVKNLGKTNEVKGIEEKTNDVNVLE